MTDTQSVNHCSASNRVARFIRILSIIPVVAMLSACADDSTSDDRRFANQPSTEAAVVDAPAEQAPAATPPPPAPQASPESLLEVEDAPEVIYSLLDGVIAAVDTTGSEPANWITAPAAQRFVAIAPSPVDERVAALAMPAGDAPQTGAIVSVYDEEGSVLDQWSEFPSAGDRAATPQPGGSIVFEPTASISWSLPGDRLLVAPGGSELVTIDIDGEASALPIPAPVQQADYAAWAPHDDQIAILTRNAEGSGVIWVFSPYVDGVSMRQVAPPNADAADLGSVTRFAWLPDGSGLAYILAEGTGTDARGGELYTINLRLGIRLLVAAPGRGGPAAEIVQFALSPDGQAVAYVISIPDGDRWLFHSLWVRSVQSQGRYDVPVGNTEHVQRVWWAGPGIVWQQRTGDTVTIVAHAPGSVPASVFTLEPGADATPAVTPAAATPRATPVVATPLAATPVSAIPAPATPGTTLIAATPVN